jgi:hypothetical protein
LSYAQDLTAAGTDYGPPFVCTGSTTVKITVANAAVRVQLGRGIGGLQWSDVPAFLIPGVHTIPGPIDAVRVKRATLIGTQPQYALEAY